MKKRLLFLLVIGLTGALPLSAWADVTLITTADGTKFTFGLREKFVVFTNQDHDLVEDFNFSSFISPDRALKENNVAVQNFANITFTLEKGPLRIHANLEMEAGADAASTDVNNPNLERIALYYKIPTLGTLAAGLDVHAFDPEGALIYTDEHPGLWLVGSSGDVSWDISWHRVLDCQRGGSLFGGALGPVGPCDALVAVRGEGLSELDADQISDIFGFRLNFTPIKGTTISPLFVYYRRYVPQDGTLNEFSCPTGQAGVAGVAGCVGNSTGDFDSRSDQFRPGVAVKSTVGPVIITGEAVGLLGEIRGLSSAFLGGKPATPLVEDEYDLQSFALFLEVALDGAAIGWPGWTPYVNFEWHKGDGDPFDDKYSGYVAISNLSAALRKDGFKGQSISSYGPPTLGAGSQDGWGFDVVSRGTGPTLGGILPDETLGLDATSFNNRGGKGGNAGFMKVSGGVLGKIDENWDTHIGVSAFWYDQLEAIRAEAAQNILARSGLGDPLSDSDVKALADGIKASGFLDSHFMGVEINANIGYNINNFRIQPFVSVFIPGSVVKDIHETFLGDGSGLRRDSTTAVTGGVEFSAAF